MITLSRNWGWIALRGVAGLLFGVLTLMNPLISLATLVLLFGAYALADGVFTVVAAIANRREEPHWMALLLGGLVGIATGLITFFLPGITAIALLFLIAAWAVVTGIVEIVVAIKLRKVITGEWLLVVAGVLSVLFGVGLVLFPGPGALAVVLWIGAWAIVMGIMFIALALRLRSWNLAHAPATAVA
jgi:uncharacterized membrane protein HdeD (DUF308 family)